MICQCPKCDAKVQLDLSHIPEEGAGEKCPECKTRFWISKESFARRALKKEGKSYCYYCNNELSNYLDCPTCGVMYPDYCVVQLAKPVKRLKRKTSSAMSFSFRPQKRSRSGLQQLPAERSSKSPKSILVAVAVLVIIAVLAAAVGISYFNKRAEQRYTAGFFRALYGIKLGKDFSIKVCGDTSAATRARMTAGQGADLRVDDNARAKMDSVKTDIDALMQKIPAPPKKYAKTNENLVRLYGVFSKSYALSRTPTGSLQSYIDSSAKVDSEFKQAAQDLKMGFPPQLAEDFQKALPKYKALQDF